MKTNKYVCIVLYCIVLFVTETLDTDTLFLVCIMYLNTVPHKQIWHNHEMLEAIAQTVRLDFLIPSKHYTYIHIYLRSLAYS